MSKPGFACTILSGQFLFSGSGLYEDTPIMKQAKALDERLYGRGATVDVYGASDLKWSVGLVKTSGPRPARARPAK